MTLLRPSRLVHWLKFAFVAAEARALALVAIIAGGVWAMLHLASEVREGYFYRRSVSRFSMALRN